MLAGMFSGKLFSTTEDAQLPVGGTGTRCCHQPGLQQPLCVFSPSDPSRVCQPVWRMACMVWIQPLAKVRPEGQPAPSDPGHIQGKN